MNACRHVMLLLVWLRSLEDGASHWFMISVRVNWKSLSVFPVIPYFIVIVTNNHYHHYLVSLLSILLLIVNNNELCGILCAHFRLNPLLHYYHRRVNIIKYCHPSLIIIIMSRRLPDIEIILQRLWLDIIFSVAVTNKCVNSFRYFLDCNRPLCFVFAAIPVTSPKPGSFWTSFVGYGHCGYGWNYHSDGRTALCMVIVSVAETIYVVGLFFDASPISGQYSNFRFFQFSSRCTGFIFRFPLDLWRRYFTLT
jgi:hypothetical protein